MDMLPPGANGRYLDEIESFSIGNGSAAPWMIEFKGTINHSAMERTVRVLSDRYPILRARLSLGARGYWLNTTAESYPDVVFAKGTRAMCVDTAAAMKIGMYPSLSWFLLVEDNDRGYLVICISHAVVDAHQSFTYISEFWTIYNEILNGLHINDKQAAGIPKEPSKILKSRKVKCNWPDLANWRDPARDSRAISRPSVETYIPNPKDNQVISMCSHKIILSKLETDTLLESARFFGVTAGALLVGMLATKIHDRNPIYGQSTMTIGAAVDHRRKLDPPLHETESTCATVFMRYVTVCLALANPVELAKQFMLKLDEKIEQYKYEVCEDGSLFKECSINLNNYGRVPTFRCPSDLELTDLSLIGRIPERRVLTSVNRSCRSDSIPSSLLCYTFNDRMYIASTIPDNPDGRITNEFQELCRDVGRHLKQFELQ